MLSDGRRVGRYWAMLVFAAAGALGVSSCATARVATFHPAGAAPSPAPATSLSPSKAEPVATPAQAGPRLPAGFTISFQAAAAGSAKRQAVVAGYENYVRSFWLAIITHGRDRRYRQYLAGNALTFAEKEIAYFTSHRATVRGAARYFDIKVTNMYSGKAAVVQACVDVSGLSRVTAATGKRVGNVYPHRYLHYLEQVAEGQLPAGDWYVLHTGNYSAATSEGAACQ